MPDDVTIPPHDREAVYVFAADPASPGMEPLGAPPPLNGAAHETVMGAMGAQDLDPDHIEILDPQDLTGLGLATYLTEGLGLDPEAVGPDASRLNAISGPVVLLHGSAARGEERHLSTGAGMTFIGRYPALQARESIVPLTAASARPEPAASAQAPAPAGRRMKGGTVALILAVAVAVVALLAFI